MKRIHVPPRKCAACPAYIPRRRHPKGKLESPTSYNRKRTCSSKCATKLRTQRTNAHHYCEYAECGKKIERKRRPCGTPERWADFRKRRWCGVTCRWLWSEATWYERECQRSAKIKSCILCEVAAQRHRLGSEYCKSCGYQLKKWGMRWIAANPGFAGRSERTHRTNLMKRCEHKRVRAACKLCREVALAQLRQRQAWRERRQPVIGYAAAVLATLVIRMNGYMYGKECVS